MQLFSQPARRPAETQDRQAGPKSIARPLCGEDRRLDSPCCFQRCFLSLSRSLSRTKRFSLPHQAAVADLPPDPFVCAGPACCAFSFVFVVQ